MSINIYGFHGFLCVFMVFYNRVCVFMDLMGVCGCL